MPKYPLKQLLEHREQTVTDATEELARASRARRAAEQAHAQAEGECRRAEEGAERVRAEEQGRLARGELRALDLAQAGAWEVGARACVDELARFAREAGHRAGEATAAEVTARDLLARKTADRDAVAKDKSRFDQREKERVLAAEEEAAAEAFGGRRSP
jgi:hypothetical protein